MSSFTFEISTKDSNKESHHKVEYNIAMKIGLIVLMFDKQSESTLWELYPEGKISIVCPDVVTSVVLNHILKFCEHYSKPENKYISIKKPLPVKVQINVLFDNFSQNFIDSIGSLYGEWVQLANSADALNIPELINLTTAVIAEKFYINKPINEIRSICGFTDDLSEQEKRNIEIQNGFL